MLLYQSPDTILADTDSTVNSLIPAAYLDGTFQATGGGHLTTNYILYDVPAGEYFLFVWVDQNENGVYDHLNDLIGFYDEPIEPATAWTRIAVEPGAPNVVMSANGIVDIDVWVGLW